MLILTSSCSGKDINDVSSSYHVNANNQQGNYTNSASHDTTLHIASQPQSHVPVDPLLHAPVQQAMNQGHLIAMPISLARITSSLDIKLSNMYQVSRLGIDSGGELKINIIFNKIYYQEQKPGQIFIQGVDENITRISYLFFAFHHPDTISSRKDIQILQALVGSIKNIKNYEEITNELLKLHNKKIQNNEFEYFDNLVTTRKSVNGYLLELNTVQTNEMASKEKVTMFYIYKSNYKPKKFNSQRDANQNN